MFDDGMIVMPLKEAQLYFRQKGAVNNIEIFLEDPQTARTRMREFRLEFPDPEIWFQDWMSRNGQFIGVLQVETQYAMFISHVAMIVSGSSLSISFPAQIMLVNDKVKRHCHHAHHGRQLVELHHEDLYHHRKFRRD